MDGLLRNPKRNLPWWGLIVGALGAAYTHYYGVHLIIVCYVILMWRAAQREAGWQGLALKTVWAGVVTALGLLPWIPAFAQGYLWSRGHSTAYQRAAGVYHPEADRVGDAMDALRLAAGYPEGWHWLALAGLVLGIVLYRRRAQLSRWRAALLWAALLWFLGFEVLNRETFLHGL
jgi:hypothetical protein